MAEPHLDAGVAGDQRRMAGCASDVERVVAGCERAPEGRARIAAPPGVAFDFLAPLAGVPRSNLGPSATNKVLQNESES